MLLASAEDAGRAVDMFNGFNWQGRVLEVRLDRLGVGLGEIDAGVAMVPAAALGVGVGAGLSPGAMQGMGVQGLNGAATQLSVHGLHVPAPQAPLPFVGRQACGLGVSSPAVVGNNSHPASAALSPAAAAFSSNLSQTLASAASPLAANALNPALLALHHQQQQYQQQQAERERDQEELLATAARLGWNASQLGSLGSLGTFGGGNTGAQSSLNALAELERNRAQSTGLRSLFVGNVSSIKKFLISYDIYHSNFLLVAVSLSMARPERSFPPGGHHPACRRISRPRRTLARIWHSDVRERGRCRACGTAIQWLRLQWTYA